jgi:hypothetical protein
MEENKFYTPKIEEFHVGFEFEWLYNKDNTWQKSTQEYVDPGLFDNGDGEHPFEYQLSDVGIRVKYLDKSDIESEGFELKPEKDIILEHDFLNLEVFEPYRKGEYTLIVDKRTNINIGISINDKIRCANPNGTFPQMILFRGTIKNLSELKVLLSQLDIK